MSLPGFSANASLYKTKRYYTSAMSYATTASIWSSQRATPRIRPRLPINGHINARRPPSPFDPVSCSAVACELVINNELQSCIDECFSTPPWFQPLCFEIQKINCGAVAQINWQKCKTDPTFQCQVLGGGGSCCSGVCVNCQGNQVVNPATCQCECPAGQIPCPSTGQCVDACPPGQFLNDSCVCECSTGGPECGGVCCNSNEQCCSSPSGNVCAPDYYQCCGSTPCEPSGQCCGEVCCDATDQCCSGGCCPGWYTCCDNGLCCDNSGPDDCCVG